MMKSILMLGLLLSQKPVLAIDVEFSFTEKILQSNSGHIKLEWDSEGPSDFVLQQDITNDFTNPKTIYQGPDRASFVSGLPNGNYYYRVRSDSGKWSETLLVTVQHQSLRLAFMLAGLGAIVFMMTVFVVIKGYLKSK